MPTLPFPIVLLSLIVAGAIQTLTLAPFNYWILGPASIALILWSTRALHVNQVTTNIQNDNAQNDNAQSKHHPKTNGFLYGWVFGLGLFGSGASWVYVSINTYGHAPPALAAGLTLFFVAGLALFTALNFWLYFKLKTDNILKNGLLFLCVWVLGDGFRTIFLTGFPWLFLGYGHLNSPLAGWIPILGIYGITALSVASGITIALLIAPVPNGLKIKSAIAILLFWLSGPLLNHIQWASENKPALKVALIQTNIPQEEKWKPSQRWKTLRLLEKMSQKQWHNDIIIWPETAVPKLYDLAKPFIDKMSLQAEEHKSNIISGIPFRSIDQDSGTQTLHNSIVSFGKGDGIYHKQKLVPFGEYVPLQDILRGLIAFFNLPMSDFRTGAPDQALLDSFGYVASPFICYEVVYPDFVASRAKDADYLLTISNDSWFGESIGPLQHLEMAQMRAAENARYMVRGTNNGISAMINEKGLIIDQTEQFVRTTLESELRSFSGRTPFSYLGSYPLFILCGFTLIWFFAISRISKSRLSGSHTGITET
jgi:apolipoprotein N-acyltransferase